MPTYSDPALWEHSKAMAREALGGHSARAMQMAGKIYRAAGGRYIGKPTKAQKSLKRWSAQDWTTKSGKPSRETGERYLPRKVIEGLTAAEYGATTRAKREGTAAGQQFVKQPKRIAAKTAALKGNPTMKKPTPAQLAARARFAEMARSGAFKKKAAKARKAKANPAKKTVSQKISQLTREGYPQKQAVAIALSEERAGKVKRNPRASNPAPKFSVGDEVKFAPAVVKRVGGDARTKNMRGVIVEIMGGGKVALVDTRGTFVSEEGNSVRGIPTANLALDVKRNPASGEKRSRTKLNPVMPEARSRLPSNFKYGVQTKATENWALQAAFKTKAEAVDYAQAIAKNYPRLPIRVITFTGGPI